MRTNKNNERRKTDNDLKKMEMSEDFEISQKTPLDATKKRAIYKSSNRIGQPLAIGNPTNTLPFSVFLGIHFMEKLYDDQAFLIRGKREEPQTEKERQRKAYNRRYYVTITKQKRSGNKITLCKRTQ